MNIDRIRRCLVLAEQLEKELGNDCLIIGGQQIEGREIVNDLKRELAAEEARKLDALIIKEARNEK